MEILLFFSALGLVVAMALGMHIYRDVRGKARNGHGQCYACGKNFSQAGLRIVPHHGGGTYGYCLCCAERHVLVEQVFALLGCLALSALFAVLCIDMTETHPVKAWVAGAMGVAFLLGALALCVHLLRRLVR